MMLSHRRRLILGTLALTSMLLSIAIQWQIIVGLGPGAMTDAYFASQVVPTVLMVIIGSSVSHVLVPFVIEMTPGERQVNTWGMLLAFMAIFGSLSAVLFISAPAWVAVLFPGFSAELVELTITLSRILSFVLLFGGMSAVLTAVHQAEHRFLLPEAWMLVSTLIMLVGVTLGLATYGIILVAWLSLLRHATQFLFLLGGIPRPALDGFRLRVLGELWQRARPLLLGSSIYKTGPIIDRNLASMTPVGGITIIAFAQQLYGIALTLADKAFATPFIAITSTLMKQGKHATIRRMYWRMWSWSLIVSLAIWVVIILAGEWALELFLGYGLVKTEDIATLSTVMAIMGGVLAGGATGQLSAAGLYACRKSADVARIAVINFIIATLIKVIGFLTLGLYGIVVGIVAYQVINAVVLHIKLDRTYREEYA
jgi:peptidoglycan biosynthesis protein MviN/MurJ (putative lipid II flippase)